VGIHQPASQFTSLPLNNDYSGRWDLLKAVAKAGRWGAAWAYDGRKCVNGVKELLIDTSTSVQVFQVEVEDEAGHSRPFSVTVTKVSTTSCY
jgi:hypothetical protein